MSNKSLNELCVLANENAKAKGFDDMNIPTKLMLIVTEVSEAMEDYRKGLKPDEFTYEDARPTKEFGNHGLPGKPTGIPSEIADIVIRCMDFCGRFGIDLERAINEKMVYNSTRPEKHGGKKV